MAHVDQPCPHCGGELVKWLVPVGASWSEEYFLACFSDDCPYYKDGWTWMESQYGQKASFRYAFNPETGTPLPIPVWSDSATREMIVEDEEGNEQ